ncbi:MAG: hypothetical protein Q4C85_09475 [Actinomyces sp.]|uniref:hypothetical protein n=1 Tax=Actinomyces sp. TaxID=29317 RepID=UPI0026DC79BB|nr:hypothetical protein [Actinomyces sp.]MDO4243967.1 hypothetical protein [Actinomyces sp.]
MSTPTHGSSTDLAVSLPTDTATFSAAGMFPVGRIDTHHMLVLADDVTADEVEALALSLDSHAGWVGASRLQLVPGVELQGPWEVDEELRRLMGLPAWATQVMLLECPPHRTGPLPAALAGIDPVTDAFPLAQPGGAELEALTSLRSIARRLAGGLRLAGDAPDGGASVPVLVVPDPEMSVSLTVFSPVWIAPEGVVALVASHAPGARLHLTPTPVRGATGLAAIPVDELERLAAELGEDVLDEAWRLAERRREEAAELEEQARLAGHTIEEERDGYAVVAEVDASQIGWGGIEVRVQGAEDVPLSVRGEAWAQGGVISYSIVWNPHNPSDARSENLPAHVRAERSAARSLIEDVSQAIQRAAGGVMVDDDGFLVAL